MLLRVNTVLVNCVNLCAPSLCACSVNVCLVPFEFISVESYLHTLVIMRIIVDLIFFNYYLIKLFTCTSFSLPPNPSLFFLSFHGTPSYLLIAIKYHIHTIIVIIININMKKIFHYSISSSHLSFKIIHCVYGSVLFASTAQYSAMLKTFTSEIFSTEALKFTLVFTSNKLTLLCNLCVLQVWTDDL